VTTPSSGAEIPGEPVDPYDSTLGPHPAHPDPTVPAEIYPPTPRPPDPAQNLPATRVESQPWNIGQPQDYPSYPPASGYPASGYPTYPPAGGYPPPGGYPTSGYPPGYSAPPAAYSTPPGYPVIPPILVVPPTYAPFGVDPVTGRPLSDKSKVVAGLLQLLPGGLLTLGGIGRLYAGHVALGIFQLVGTLIAWTGIVCGIFTLGFGWCLTVPFWLWFVIDGIVLLAGRPVDGAGRPLRS
jgi:TM2 domain-containing membrane protein YozV